MNTSWSNSLNLKSSSGESTEFVAFCDSRAFEQVFQYSVKSTCKRSWNADSCESQIDTFEAIDVRHHFRLQGRRASYRSAWSVLVPGFESVWKHNILLWHDPWHDIRSNMFSLCFHLMGAHTHSVRCCLQEWDADLSNISRKLRRGLGGDGLLWPLSCERPSRCRRSSCTVYGTADVSQKDHRDVWKR